MQNGELEALEVPIGGIFHRRLLHTAGRVKTGIVVHGLHTHQGLNSFFQLRQAEDGVNIYL